MSRRAALFVVTAVLNAMALNSQAAMTEIPVKGNEKLIISVPEAVINVQATPGQRLKINLGEAAQDEFTIQTQGSLIRIEPREAVPKERLGRFVPKKRLIEIQGPSIPLEIHAFDGQVQLSRWSREALLQVQKGHLTSREGTGTLTAHSQAGDIQILDHQGRVAVDSYKAAVTIRNLNGDADVENFAGETVVDKAHGFLSFNQGQGATKILGSGGTLQFEATKGVFNVVGFQGRVEGQSSDGPINVTMGSESDVSLRSQKGRVVVQTPANSGAALNLISTDGEIQVPNYLHVNRESSQKTLRGRMKGDAGKGSVVVRSQEGTIIIR